MMVNFGKRFHITSSSYGEDGSRPQRPLYPWNNFKILFHLHTK